MATVVIGGLWQEINERFGEMLINFRIALLDALKKTGEQFMTITEADFMRHSMIEATESTDWAAVVFPPPDS